MSKKILVWDKLPKKMSTEEWKSISADGAPPGVYVTNLSDQDRKKWRAKLVGKRSGFPQVEIRKGLRGADLLIIVSLGTGYKYSHYTHEKTQGVNVHLSTNGAAQMTFAEMEEMYQAISEARAALEE